MAQLAPNKHTKNLVSKKKKAIHTFKHFILLYLPYEPSDAQYPCESHDVYQRSTMQESCDVALSNLGTLRSPGSTSTDSNRRGFLRATYLEKHAEPSTPSSPKARSTRKRAASLDLDGTNSPRLSDLALNSASNLLNPKIGPVREQVCLCQPDPKIPRPRNAFILYRQHYQAQVVAQHPGLANPEISKIIGEQWREQAEEVKVEWKRLAEEEKQRHQRQYPDYRYQPRRSGKGNGTRPVPSASVEDPVRCPKCSGRYISTPSTPLTPFTPAVETAPSLSHNHLLPPFIPSRNIHDAEKARHLPHMHNTRMDTPRMNISHHQENVGAPYRQPLHTYHEMDEDMEPLSPSQDQKRRRFNHESRRFDNEDLYGLPLSSPISTSPSQLFSRSIGPPGPYRQQQRQQLPGPGMLTRVGTMGPPPPSPIKQQPRNQYPARSNTFDESLRLPPLQAKRANIIPQRSDGRTDNRDSHARSVEAMISTIPYTNKIKVLTKISPPLAAAAHNGLVHEDRGVVIAVEGSDNQLLADTGDFVKDHLHLDASCAVQTWGTSTAITTVPATPPSDTEVTDQASSNALEPAEQKNPFVEYLSIISEWHTKSHEIIKYITKTPTLGTELPTTSGTPNVTKPKVLPVVLIPNGFSLTISDTFALQIPISDSYTSVDHWQWMATLWRGIVGPDLTIYVTRSGRDDVSRFGGVEMRWDCNTIIVRVPGGGKMDEKTARRLGFEITEFVRGVHTGLGRN